MTFRCGCAVEPESPSDRCPAHRYTRCHTSQPADMIHPGECPPCWRHRMLSVNTDYATTHLARMRETEQARQRDAALGVRLAEPGEFPADLTMHSKVRR